MEVNNHKLINILCLNGLQCVNRIIIMVFTGVFLLPLSPVIHQASLREVIFIYFGWVLSIPTERINLQRQKTRSDAFPFKRKTSKIFRQTDHGTTENAMTEGQTDMEVEIVF